MATTFVTIADLTAALRDRDIEYRVEHAGTDLATIIVTAESGDEIALGPADATDVNEAGDGVNLAWYDGTASDGHVGTTDWIQAATEAVATVARWLTK